MDSGIAAASSTTKSSTCDSFPCSWGCIYCKHTYGYKYQDVTKINTVQYTRVVHVCEPELSVYAVCRYLFW